MQQLSSSVCVKMLQSGNLKGVSDSLPATIKGAIEQPPISELMKVMGRSQVVRFIEFELIKMTTLVSVGGNLNNAQVEFIATQLVELFPNETLADFKICFQRGCIGQYGEIYRMDGIVLRKWMEKYLDEKYEVLVDDLNRNYKDNPHQKPEPEPDGPGYKAFKEYAKSLTIGAKVPGISDADIRKYGQEKPVEKKATGHAFDPVASAEQLRMQDLRMQYGRERCDKYTGKPLPGAISFEDFIKNQQQEK